MQQKFPAAAISSTTAAPAEQHFQHTLSGLDDVPSFTDLSALNEEAAGAHGFVRAASGHFVDDRGTRLRFFGVNLTGIACLPDHATATRLARHFRKLGFNAVRLHALDSTGALLTSDGQLASEALARLDYFTSELKAQGIYFSLGLHTAAGYPGLDGEAQARYPQGKVLDRFHSAFLLAQQHLARDLLGHENPYTRRRYVYEPALLYVELNHEDTLLPSTAGSPDQLPASYRAELGSGYASWLAERTADGLRAPGPADEEAKHELPTFHDSPSARADYAQFLSATEEQHVKQLVSFIRSELKLHSMLLSSQASFGGLAGVLREAELSDFIDMHGYWDRPGAAPASEALGTLRNTTQIRAADAGTLGMLASYRVFGKPFTVSEYGYPGSNDYAAEMFPLLAGIAGLQDWDALFAFAYVDQTRDYEPQRLNGVFDLAGHPAQLAFVTAAASSFRRGLVSAGQGRVELSVPRAPRALPYTEDALPELWRANGVPLSAATLEQLGIALRSGSGEVNASSAVQVSSVLGSDTGELLWDTQGPHARFSIDAPALKLVCGMLANSELKFDGVSFAFPDFTPGFACASLLSLDQRPIASAQRLLLTVAGRSEPAQQAPAGSVLVQYVPITVSLPRAVWRAQALDAAGRPVRALAVVSVSDSKISTTLRGAALSYAITR